MNYLTEIKLFYDWLETHTLSDSAVAMWHGLMFIANRAGWQENLTVSMESLRLRTQIPRSSIYRVREQLEEAGLIKVIQQGGRNCPVYVPQSANDAKSAIEKTMVLEMNRRLLTL